MPENNGGRPATVSRWGSGGLEETTLGRAPPSDRLLSGWNPFSGITIILDPTVRDTIPADLQTNKENPCHPDKDRHHILSRVSKGFAFNECAHAGWKTDEGIMDVPDEPGMKLT
jgi:hypothetical protein